jgi:hypothetical protein
LDLPTLRSTAEKTSTRTRPTLMSRRSRSPCWHGTRQTGPERERERRAVLQSELAVLAEFDAQLAARVEERIAERL